jgi:acetate kinase
MASNESHILVINSGSSSLKVTVFDPASGEVLASGIAERLGTDGAGLKLVDLAQKRHDEESPMADHRSALLRIIELLTKSGRFGVKAIGHRVVHGGGFEAVIVTEDVIEKIENLRVSPLHNRPMPRAFNCRRFSVTQVAVFDTGFFADAPRTPSLSHSLNTTNGIECAGTASKDQPSLSPTAGRWGALNKYSSSRSPR